MKIAIIGSGLVGRVMGLTLLTEINNISLDFYEKSNDFNGNTSCGHAAAGMVAPICELIENNIDLYHLGQKSIPIWSCFNQLLQEKIFSLSKTWVLAHQYDKNEFNAFKQKIYGFDINHTLLKEKELCREEIDKNAFNYNLLNHYIEVDGEGYVDTDLFFKQSCDFFAMAKEKVRIYTNRDICSAEINTLKQQYDWVIDTRGMGAKENLPNLYGIRGEALLIHAPNVHIQNVIRLCHPRYPLYIVPRKNHHYYIGASIIQNDDYSDISLKSMMDLLSALSVISHQFLEARVVKTYAQVRPTFNTGMPKSIIHDNIISINGFYRHGYLLSPVLCKQVITNHILEKTI
ncbi:FAD-dependent oxidoreductase [Fangia hongkongensis]|uniref:FAD-dependent oxidoreductase n=1 Tax=Fangia hongkongensis TaxID=270495 RepID=UPI000365BE85|nr:FAD-dependent oxidoreductase [Fangia hongkongensis]MBK2124974.1 FAD-dependent oxidoreductase [Fangia hongkongensis]